MAEVPRPGYFVALEGAKSDYTGAVLKLLAEQLREHGYQPLVMTFPRIEQAPGFYAKEYDSGKFGNPMLVNPYAATLYFALDYHQAAIKISDYLAVGGVVLVSGYQVANMARQGLKFDRQEERFGYYTWCDNLAEQVLGLPRPDLAIVLKTDTDQDAPILPEPDMESAYRDIQQLFPKDVHSVDMVRAGLLLDSGEAANQIRKIISPDLPEPRPILFDVDDAPEAPMVEIPLNSPQKQAETSSATTLIAPGTSEEDYFVPELSGDVLEDYKTTINKILKLNKKIERKLQATKDSDILVQLPYLNELTKPVAFYSELVRLTVAPTGEVAKIIDKHLSKGHGDPEDRWRLSSVSPRNELDKLPTWLFERSNLPLTDLESMTEELSYDDKQALFESLLKECIKSKKPVGINYQLEGPMSLIEAQSFLRSFKKNQLSWQEMTPRLGYAMPKAFEAVGAVDEYLECFDLSFELYSKLQSQAEPQIAQYAVLMGNKIRVSTYLSPLSLTKLRALGRTNEYIQQTIAELLEKIQGTHPITYEIVMASEGEE